MKKLWSPLMGLEESGTLPDEKTVDARRGMQKNPQRFAGLLAGVPGDWLFVVCIINSLFE
jgi:hypothetical protein